MNEERKRRLDKIFLNMKANMSKVDLLSMYSHEIFNDFPKNLPKKSLDQFKKDIEILNIVKKELTSFHFNLLTEENYTKLGISKEFHRFLHNVSIVQSEGQDEIESINFEQVLYRQELISLYSYLEGYFQDLQRLLFENDKILLENKDKEIPLTQILDASNYEKLISSIIDDKLVKSGYEKISSIIAKWKREPFKIILKLKKAELEKLDKFTCIRNIIIHNNAKINDGLLCFLDKKSYKTGQNFKITSEIMKEFRDLIFNIVFSAYVEICTKYPTIIKPKKEEKTQ